MIIVFCSGLAASSFLSATHPASLDSKPVRESVYERVMRAQTIRCGYIVWTPFIIKDPNTGRLSGIFFDYVEGLGDRLHLKIEWTEETTWGDFPAALDNGRFDAMCAGSYANPERARIIDFVRPILYQPMYAYARIDDKRFDNHLDAINASGVTIIAVDGSTPGVVAAQDFPKARKVQLPEMTSLSESFVNLVAGKGDVVIDPASTADGYDAHNPGKIRRIPASTPLRVFGDSIAVAGGEDRFRRMLDIATDEMLSSGLIERISAKYDTGSGALLRVALPYQGPNAEH